MSNWQEGQYNSDYILHHKSIVGQIKYESKSDPARLDEISIERHDNGNICIVFTTHPDATNDVRQRGIHARLAYNTLFQEMQRLVSRTNLEYVTTNLEEVHRIRGHKGQERSLLQALVLLEEYDNSLADISVTLRHYVAPERATLADINDEITLQKQRLHLLERVLDNEVSTGRVKRTSAKKSRRSKFKQKTIARKRGSSVSKRRRA